MITYGSLSEVSPPFALSHGISVRSQGIDLLKIHWWIITEQTNEMKKPMTSMLVMLFDNTNYGFGWYLMCYENKHFGCLEPFVVAHNTGNSHLLTIIVLHSSRELHTFTWIRICRNHPKYVIFTDLSIVAQNFMLMVCIINAYFFFRFLSKCDQIDPAHAWTFWGVFLMVGAGCPRYIVFFPCHFN